MSKRDQNRDWNRNPLLSRPSSGHPEPGAKILGSEVRPIGFESRSTRPREVIWTVYFQIFTSSLVKPSYICLPCTTDMKIKLQKHLAQHMESVQ